MPSQVGFDVFWTEKDGTMSRHWPRDAAVGGRSGEEKTGTSGLGRVRETKRGPQFPGHVSVDEALFFAATIEADDSGGQRWSRPHFCLWVSPWKLGSATRGPRPRDTQMRRLSARSPQPTRWTA